MFKKCNFCGDLVLRLQTKEPPSCRKCYRKYLNPERDPRDERIQVNCEFQSSNKCLGTHQISKRSEIDNRKRNEGTYICFYCSRDNKFSGRKNPNARYDLDDNFFADINSEQKAYVLGFVASGDHINNRGIFINIRDYDIEILKQIRDAVSNNIPIKLIKGNMVSLSMNSKKLAKDASYWLEVGFGKKSNCVKFPQLNNDLKIHFIRGFFDGGGFVSSLNSLKNSPRCGIGSNSPSMLKDIGEFLGVPNSISGSHLEWNGNNALDVLGKIYDNSSIRMSRKYNLYMDWSMWQPSLGGGNWGVGGNSFKWVKTDKRAVAPFKSKASDSGFDLTIIDVFKDLGDTKLYTTGIKVQPQFGYYFDLVPRSSLIKTGYILHNSVGIIDRTYLGPVLVALRKIDNSAPDLELPCRVAQLIPRHIIHFEWEEVQSEEEMLLTSRGVGGFGSTGR